MFILRNYLFFFIFNAYISVWRCFSLDVTHISQTKTEMFALSLHPVLALLLSTITISHISPVPKIAAIGREKGVATLVDAETA